MRRDSITRRFARCKPSTAEPCDVGEVNSKLKSGLLDMCADISQFETCANHVLVFHFILALLQGPSVQAGAS